MPSDFASMLPVAVPLIAADTGHQVKARIEWGHWLADCGSPYCENAMRLTYGTDLLCEVCGAYTPVLWPSETDARAICVLLGYRPNPKNRNWLPYEKPSDLAFENMAHGVPMADSPQVGAARSWAALDVSGDGDPQVIVFDEPVTIDAAKPQEIEE